MASTILRFLNPRIFQIIDARAYSVLLPDKPKYPTKPRKITNTYIEKSISIYFEYLERICEISKSSPENFLFEEADRILYQLHIELGKKIGD